ncbi:MAG: flavodoxin family protein [Bdellovibrionaceae bacterium]|nr:flavodoxin family protein [Bdellovibrio sp.]
MKGQNMDLPKTRGDKIRVLLISGSNRRQYNCPGVDSKSRALMLRMKDLLPAHWEMDVEDLGNVYTRKQIQSCNSCVSTAMSLCVWPCNCYEKNSKKEPDLMWNLDLYSRLDLADAWAIIGPVNWYGPTTTLKKMFDRLVCASGGNPREDLINHKDPELAMQLEKSPEWEKLSQNHLEGRTAAFFCHGDAGGDELDSEGKPKKLIHKNYFDSQSEPFKNMRDAYAPLVWQCRYSGIEVPDSLWQYGELGRGKKYSENQAEHIADAEKFTQRFDQWAKDFAVSVEKKGKVTANQYPAAGYKPPGHKIADLKLLLRDFKMRLGKPRKNSSPEIQQRLGLNKDATLHPSESESKHQ